ncbi:MAG: ABC transporter ATP-binding protein [Magnetococcales bacterium]|nr:ABC transporter ATP-binding protein [Magnetococcales bacterium]
MNTASSVAPLLLLEAVSCGLDSHRPVVRDLNLRVDPGEMVSLLGASGCGKTTLLRAVAGFIPLAAGQILIKGVAVARPGFSMSPERRRVGMVFQDYALFPHLTVAENVAYGLKGESRERLRAITGEMLERVGLASLARRYPHELSGGQQQRTALARALAPKPELILLDEPFSNLDVELRERLGVEVRQILETQGTTGILVTHDQHEAFAWGDKVGVLHEGNLRQWGTPYELYHQPVDAFVAGFIGQGTFLSGVSQTPEEIRTAVGILRGKPHGARIESGQAVRVLIRPDDVLPDARSPIVARVIRRAFRGASTLYTLELESGCQLQSLFPSHVDHPVGDRVPIRVSTDHLVLFPDDRADGVFTCYPASI